MVTVAIFTDAARRFGRDVKNEIFAEILSAWKSSLPPTTETLESLITAKIVETQSPLTMTVTIVVLSMGPDDIKRIEKFIKLVKEATRNSLRRANKAPFPFCGHAPRNWSWDLLNV